MAVMFCVSKKKPFYFKKLLIGLEYLFFSNIRAIEWYLVLKVVIKMKYRSYFTLTFFNHKTGHVYLIIHIYFYLAVIEGFA